MASNNPIIIDRINEGGLAESKWSGIKNSLYKLVGFDIHSKPGIVKVAQKLAKFSGDSGSTQITAFCKARVSSSNGAQYWGSSTNGKIWEITSGGVVRLVHTLTPAVGGASILGMEEHQGYLYLFTESRIHRILSTEADDNDWTNDIVEDWATFGVTDASFHPSIKLNLVLYIGDGNQVAQIDSGTFSANALDIETPLRIKSLGKYDTDLLIGTFIANTVNSASIFRWNTVDVSFASEDEVPEVGINAFFMSDNVTYVQAGLRGNIYVYNGRTLELYRKIPGDYSPTAYGEVYSTAVGMLDGNMLFGFSNGSGNPADQGVYQIGRYSFNYPWVMDMPYPISERSGGALVINSIEIGGILVVGSDIYVSWKNSTTYGIDKLNYSSKLELAYMETRVFNTGRYNLGTYPRVAVAYASLPASTDITIQQQQNYAGSYTDTVEKKDTKRKFIYTEESWEATVLQLKVLPTVSSNDAPEIESILVD